MAGSEAPERSAPAGSGDPDPVRELTELEEAVDRLAGAYEELRDRVDEAEASRRRLASALEGAELGELTPEEAAARFEQLSEENRRLRERLREGRERAERIRSRLIMMEDEL